MIETEHTVYSVTLKNNCPECYSTDGLVLSFTQKEKENKWYLKVEKNTKASIFCTNCETDIFPVRWDEHIERVYNYYFKLMQPKKAGTFFKPRFWVVATASLLIALGIAVLAVFALPLGK